MPWPTLEFTKTEINRAGRVLKKDDIFDSDFDWARDVLSNWRACHGYPLNTFQATLRNKLQRIDESAIIGQRLKRTESIVAKLQRSSTSLHSMQDIGGLRAVVESIEKVRELTKDYQKRNSMFLHDMVTKRDYVATPKTSGYRSVHLVYKYRSNNRPEALPYEDLQIELQIRTRLQHAWATAVETMGIFLRQSLKASKGDEEWLNFFKVASAAFAHVELCPAGPGFENVGTSQIFKDLRELERSLGVLNRLEGFKVAIETADNIKSGYHLVVLDFANRNVKISTFGAKDLYLATEEYSKQEASAMREKEVVLVRANDIESLKRAYPNYFLDTHMFIEHVGQITGHRS